MGSSPDRYVKYIIRFRKCSIWCVRLFQTSTSIIASSSSFFNRVIVQLSQSHRSSKQLGFLVYSGTGEHSAPVRFSGRPHAELCNTAQAHRHQLHQQMKHSSSLFSCVLFIYFFWGGRGSSQICVAYPQCVLSVLVEAQGVPV